ncbi:AtpZ/AtpI family protein [Blastochloris tepida]|uniref:ATP synthase protein I n=1 Tax=Blastochloris tepida TaxID=2233851 RepID=A0A348FW10_9HYPH|nr:AtpZ/AtpI family protein [Blastochloris tepida]BBF91493.1 ATP synthase protein I [Blastochloris tepida]
MTNGGTSDGRDGAGKRPSEAELAARLERLGRKIDLLQGKEKSGQATGEPSPQSAGSGYARAARLSSEFVGGVLVGGGLGWLLDRVLGITPWGMIVFLMLGFAAGVLNVMRAAAKESGSGPGAPDR